MCSHRLMGKCALHRLIRAESTEPPSHCPARPRQGTCATAGAETHASESAEREQQRQCGKKTGEAGAAAPGARVRLARRLCRKSRTRRGPRGQTLGRSNADATRRRAAGPQGRRAAGPQGRRAAGPQGRRAAGPQGRRAAGPQGRRAAGPQGRRAAGPQGRRAAGPQGRRAAGPQGRRAAGPQGRRAAGPQGRRAAGPQGRRAAGPQGRRAAAGPQGRRAAIISRISRRPENAADCLPSNHAPGAAGNHSPRIPSDHVSTLAIMARSRAPRNREPRGSTNDAEPRQS